MIARNINVLRNLGASAMRKPRYYAALRLNLSRNDSVSSPLAHVEAKALAHTLELGGIGRNPKSLENRERRKVVEKHKVRGFDRLCGLGTSGCGDLGRRSDIDLANRTFLDGKLTAGPNDVVRPPLANELTFLVHGSGGPGGLVGPLRKGRGARGDTDGAAFAHTA